MEFILEKINYLIKVYKTNCPFKIAKKLGIEIVYEDLGKTLGYFNQFCRIKIIHINEKTSEYQKMFICAHELGHAIFHPEANTPFLKKKTLFSTDKIELEANLFAVRLLFSKDYYDDHLNLKDAVELYGIPEKLILNNLKGENQWPHLEN
ncbi:ImmA/IrrE family metallo-endopeptidase [Heyndrickxia oleronia]|uniref:ImmA/IrrE family metallo-endopeptidase n=1 Tax=Heyndrickxia oleronia TaxID=38875 RepID=A0AAW6SXJ8_9BACI|nr:ImmA/IrrE family metallo-endopeptidase [Heyndrickxia oleronia]MDH5161476.1 ImmA/IrrE family metallo-endopeptidase [Heyndrickxia oleronia]